MNMTRDGEYGEGNDSYRSVSTSMLGILHHTEVMGRGEGTRTWEKGSTGIHKATLKYKVVSCPPAGWAKKGRLELLFFFFFSYFHFFFFFCTFSPCTF